MAQLGLKGQKRRSAARRDSAGRYSTVANSVAQRRYIRSLRRRSRTVGGRERKTSKNIYNASGGLKSTTRRRRR